MISEREKAERVEPRLCVKCEGRFELEQKDGAKTIDDKKKIFAIRKTKR